MAERSQVFKRISNWLPEVTVGVIALLLSISHMVQYTKFSPLDELRHLDYALQITEGVVPKLGDKLQSTSMREEACRGIDLEGWQDPPCYRKILKPEQFRDDGWQTASQHPPSYYVLAGTSARILKAVGITNTYVDGARLFSALMSAIGLALTCRYLRRNISSVILSVALPVAISCTGVYLHQSSIVTPDSLALFVGAVVLLVSDRFLKDNIHIFWVYAAFALAGLSKITNLLIVIVVTIAFLIFLGSKDHEIEQKNRKRMHLIAASAVSFIGGLLWIFVQGLRSTIDASIVPQNQMLAIEGLPSLNHLINSVNLFRWFPPMDSYVSGVFVNVYTTTFLMLFTWLLVGGVIFSTLNYKRAILTSNLAASVALVSVIGAPIFIVLSAVINKILINAEARYGLVLLPVFALSTATLVKERSGEIIISFLSATLLASTFQAIWF
jgi:4-amino-4-deoxy-L-arabinose transferase-like glycosyltransferase